MGKVDPHSKDGSPAKSVVEYVKLKYVRGKTFDELRITCMDGGPDDPEVVFKFSAEGVTLNTWNPREGDKGRWALLFSSILR